MKLLKQFNFNIKIVLQKKIDNLNLKFIKKNI